MGAALLDPSFIDQDDAVCVPHSGEPVGDDKSRPASPEPVKTLLYIALRHRVQGGGSLVQYQDLRVLQKQPRNAQPLPLPAGQHNPLCAHQAVIALRERGDEPVQPGQLGGLDDLGVGGVFAAVADVFADGAVEDVHLLLHDADRLPQRAQRKRADVRPVDQHPAAAGVVKPRDQRDDGRLTDAGAPGKGDGLPAADAKRNILQHVFVRIFIVEGNMLKADVSLRVRQRRRVFRFGHGGAQFDHLHKADEARLALLEQVEEV